MKIQGRRGPTCSCLKPLVSCFLSSPCASINAVEFVGGSHGDGVVWLFGCLRESTPMGLWLPKIVSGTCLQSPHSPTHIRTTHQPHQTQHTHLFPNHHPYLQSTALTLANSPSLFLAQIMAVSLLLGPTPTHRHMPRNRTRPPHAIIALMAHPLEPPREYARGAQSPHPSERWSRSRYPVSAR